MRKQEARKRIGGLKKLINYHRHLYHVLDKQEISDQALDSLKKELFDLEQKFPEFITQSSPTQRIGGKPLGKFKKVKHPVRMLSFNDAFSQEDMYDWESRISKLLDKKEISQIDYYCELKIDGLAVELIYENGIFKVGATRGNGSVGENITQSLKTIEAIPLEVLRKQNVIVRGEVFIPKKEFKKVNQEREKQGKQIYANPRNLAAGSIRQLDPKVTASRELDFFAYDLITEKAKTHEEKHDILKTIGFKVNKYNKHCHNLDEVFQFCKNCQNLREKLPYEIDGIVVIINSNLIFSKLGIVGKAPRGAIAFKFPAKQTTSIIEDIKVQVGRTGVLTPVAWIKPVVVGGTTISRATLHNEDEIKRLGVKIGDTVIVGRAGDVIPDIIKVLPELRTGREKEFKMPSHCPICSSRVEKKSGGVAYYCTNPNCFAVQKKHFYHFVSKPAFNIEGLGTKIIDQLIEEGLVSDLADIFELKQGDLILLERFAEKSAENIIKAINGSKEISLPRFIYALGIRNVGEETAQDLAETFRGLDKIRAASLEEFKLIPDVGPIVAKAVFDWFSKEKNKKLLDKIKRVGVNINEYERSGSITRTFVITGSLETVSRDEAKEMIRNMGGSVASSVSRKTDFVIVGKNPGSKYKEAKKCGVKIIDEREFLKLIKS